MRCWREALVHVAGPALDVDLLRSTDVVACQGRAAIRRRGLEDGHCVLEAGVAGGLGAAREGDVEREVVDVGVGRGGSVGDGVGEAVGIGRGVAQAGGRVEWFVGQEAEVGLGY